MSQSESKETRSPLSSALIEQELNRLGQSDVAIFVFDQVGSTNDEISQHLPKLNSFGAVVVTADEQIQGRGRLDRAWSSPWGAGIALTIAVDATHINGELTSIPLRAGLAVHNALTKFGVNAKVKWPNDIVTEQGQKLGGLLSVARDNAVLVGIGLNVSLQNEELPTPQATSLALLGYQVSREELIAQIVSQFRDLIKNEDWMPSYQMASATLGQQVRLHRVDQPIIEGKVEWFGQDGSIRISNESGFATFTIGDIEHLRSVDM